MDMSLDEIIKIKKIGTQPARKVPLRSGVFSSAKTFNRDSRIKDARFKIIERNRAKIRDARDKLAEITRSSGDARLRLARKQGLISASHRSRKASVLRTQNKKFPNDRVANVIEVPRGYVDYDNMERMEEEEYSSQLKRSVDNDFEPFRASRHAEVPWDTNGSDPFDLYNIPVSRIPPEVPDLGIRRQVRQISPDNVSPRKIRQVSPPYSRRYIPQSSSHLSYEMRSRLERAPDRNVSMGIFSNPLKPQNNYNSGYRIVVSNLHTSVTQADIKELFEDLGELFESRLVRPGVAEVIYKDQQDAEKAVETYHNRQLDGLPMKCLLVNPRSSSKPTAPAVKMSSSSSNRLTSGKTPLEIDIDALHKVLFRRH